MNQLPEQDLSNNKRIEIRLLRVELRCKLRRRKQRKLGSIRILKELKIL